MKGQQLRETLRFITPYIADLLGGSGLVQVGKPLKSQAGPSPVVAGGAEVFGTSLRGFAVGHDVEVVVTQFDRPTLPFSETETRLLHQLFAALTVLATSPDDQNRGTHQRTAIAASALDLAILRFLREDRRRFANIHNIIQTAKELTVRRYEGEPCTSGFLYVNRPRKGYLDRLKEIGYQIVPLNPGIVVAPGFFDSPLAYQYVDGVKAVYLTQIPRLCVAILQVNPRDSLTWEDVTNHIPFRLALQGTRPQAFCVFANKNSEVDVMFGHGDLLRWRGGQWRLLEITRLQSILEQFLDEKATAGLLAEVVVSVSTSRHGALILLLHADGVGPPKVRHIDESPIGQAVRRRLIGISVAEAREKGSGVFS